MFAAYLDRGCVSVYSDIIVVSMRMEMNQKQAMSTIAMDAMKDAVETFCNTVTSDSFGENGGVSCPICTKAMHTAHGLARHIRKHAGDMKCLENMRKDFRNEANTIKILRKRTDAFRSCIEHVCDDYEFNAHSADALSKGHKAREFDILRPSNDYQSRELSKCIEPAVIFACIMIFCVWVLWFFFLVYYLSIY